MAKIESSYNLVPAGYLIVQESEYLRNNNKYYQGFGTYFGVDRLLRFVWPDDVIRRGLGMPPIEDPRLRETTEEWFNARSEMTAFITDYGRALRLIERLRAYGHRLELLYCEIAPTEGEVNRLDTYEAVEGARPVLSKTYGFDISWPTCTHSAIFEPGVVPENPSWRSRLNQYGLLDDYGDALQLRDEYLRVYPHPPFDIYLVHAL
jgi:hypothetical protein